MNTNSTEITPIPERKPRDVFAAVKTQLTMSDTKTIMAYGIVFVTASLFLFVLAACRRGFEFSDETYYLINMQSPHLYDSIMDTKFGSVYKPLHDLLGGNIFLLRVCDIILKYALSFLLICLVLVEKICALSKKDVAYAMAAGVASISFMQNLHEQTWMGDTLSWMTATPSYNSLNFEALLVCMIGVVLTASESLKKKYLGAALSGCACTLCFLARPTTAAILTGCLFCYFFPVSKEKLRLLCVIYAVFLISFLISAKVISGSLPDFVVSLTNGYEDRLSLQAGHGLGIGLLRFLDLPTISAQDVILFVLAFSFLALYSVCHNTKSASVLVTVFTSVACAFFLVSPEKAQSILLPNHFYIIFVGVLALTIIMHLRKGGLQTSDLALPLLLFAMPAAYVFGTNTGYWQAANKVLLFPVIGVIALFRFLPAGQLWCMLPPFVMSMLLLVVIPITYSQHIPYRQVAPLRAQKTPIKIGGGNLMLHEAVVGYINRIRWQAQQGGFIPGTPIIDLTGHGPGQLYVLGAEAVGAPWILGAFKGSLDTATQQLRRVHRDKLRRSWILTKHDSLNGISDEVLARLNLNFPNGYEKRTQWACGEEVFCELYAPKE